MRDSPSEPTSNLVVLKNANLVAVQLYSYQNVLFWQKFA